MKYRKLRVAFSVACGIICLLLIALWVRSYWRFDQFIRRVSITDYVAYTSFQGQLAYGMSNDPVLRVFFKQSWSKRGFRTSEWEAALRRPFTFFPSSPNPDDSRIIVWPRYDKQAFYMTTGGTYAEVIMPYWFLFLLAATLGTLPWLKWPMRFSLRTLLIATTLFAVVLGVIVYASR